MPHWGLHCWVFTFIEHLLCPRAEGDRDSWHETVKVTGMRRRREAVSDTRF